MGFVCGILLMFMQEEDVFWLLERMMHSDKYALRNMFKEGLPTLNLYLVLLEKLIEDHCPLLSAHFKLIGVRSSMFASQWFISIFTYNFPVQVSQRVLDWYFLEGPVFLLKLAMALLHQFEQDITATKSIEQCLPTLRHLQTNSIDADQLITDALQFPLDNASFSFMMRENDGKEDPSIPLN